MADRTVGHYRFLNKLGAGGMGEIYQAQDTRLGRLVAIKVLSAASADTPELRRRFVQEAQAASNLNHPNIITIHDILTEGGSEFIVMEFVRGSTLVDLIPPGGLELPRALKYAVQMSGALTAAHDAGIVHRDLKPANVMINESGLLKVLDFGLAKLTDRGLVSASNAVQEGIEPSLTMEGCIMGTVNYMSPEQAQGKKVDQRSDIFSFGVVLYEMLTGTRAFSRENTVSTLSAILRDDVKPIREVAPHIPTEMEQLIERCLRKDPEERWQSMRELRERLLALERETGTGRFRAMATKLAAAESRTLRRIKLVAAMSLAALAVAAIFAVRGTMRLAGAPDIRAVSGTTAPTRPEPVAVPPENAPAVTPTKAPTPEPAPAPVPAPVEMTLVTVSDGTPISIALSADVPADAAEGQPVLFQTTEDLRAGQVVIIPKGSTVKGAIVEAGKKRVFGFPRGRLTFRLLGVVSPDGKELKLRATAGRRAASEDPPTRPLDAFNQKHAKDVAAAAGAPYVAYIDGDQTVSVQKE